jgi:CRISPR/Cas system Type II protein with McrA/HNH and RuvC-like nuclease domain
MFLKINNPNQWYKIDAECIVDDNFNYPLRMFILQRDHYTCQYCGERDSKEVDHVFPKSRGGLSIPSNLVCSCKSCNSAKKDKTPEEWINKEWKHG